MLKSVVSLNADSSIQGRGGGEDSAVDSSQLGMRLVPPAGPGPARCFRHLVGPFTCGEGGRPLLWRETYSRIIAAGMGREAGFQNDPLPPPPRAPAAPTAC